MTDKIQIGRINGVHGIKGWNKVYSYTDPKEQILAYSPWLLCKGKKQRSVKVLSGKLQGKGVIAQLEEIEDRNQAEEIVGYEIWIARDALPDLEIGEYYWHQLEGMSVVTGRGERLGIVDHLMETGANDVMVVKPDALSIDDQERLVPYVEGRVVTSVDLDHATVTVEWGQDY